MIWLFLVENPLVVFQTLNVSIFNESCFFYTTCGFVEISDSDKRKMYIISLKNTFKGNFSLKQNITNHSVYTFLFLIDNDKQHFYQQQQQSSILLTTDCLVISPGAAIPGTLAITNDSIYYTADEDSDDMKKLDQQVD